MIRKVHADSEEEWRQIRAKSIGGSDAAAILGLNAIKLDEPAVAKQ